LSPIDPIFREQATQTSFNNTIITWLKNRGLIEETADKSSVKKLVLSCDDASLLDALREVEGEDDKDWNRIITYLTEARPIDSAPQFTESLFFRFQLLDEESFSPVPINDGKYAIEARKGYLFRLRGFQPHWKNFTSAKAAKIVFGFDEKVISHIGTRLLRMPLGQRIYNKDFEIYTSAPTLGAESKLIFEREEDEFNAASYDVSLHLPIQYRGILLKFLPFPVGLLFVGLADNIAGIITSWGLPLPAYAVSLLGTLLCAISLYQFE
jgi:hypothetical protein